MIEVSYRKLLVQEPSLQAIGQRFYWVNLPAAPQFPASTLHIVGGKNEQTFDDDGLEALRVQADFWAETYLEASTLRKAYVDFLKSIDRPELSDGLILQNAEYIQPLDFWDEDENLFRLGVEHRLYFNNSI